MASNLFRKLGSTLGNLGKGRLKGSTGDLFGKAKQKITSKAADVLGSADEIKGRIESHVKDTVKSLPDAPSDVTQPDDKSPTSILKGMLTSKTEDSTPTPPKDPSSTEDTQPGDKSSMSILKGMLRSKKDDSASPNPLTARAKDTIPDLAARMKSGVREMGLKPVVAVAGRIIDNFKNIRVAYLNGASMVEKGIGFTVACLIYVSTWIKAYDEAMSRCVDQSCTAGVILWIMVGVLYDMLITTVIALLVLVIVEKLVIRTLFSSSNTDDEDEIDDNDKLSLGLRIALAWLTNRRLLISMAAAWMGTFGFAYGYMKILDLRGDPNPAVYSVAVRRIFLFNLFAMIALVGMQLWVDWWWHT